MFLSLFTRAAWGFDSVPRCGTAGRQRRKDDARLFDFCQPRQLTRAHHTRMTAPDGAPRVGRPTCEDVPSSGPEMVVDSCDAVSPIREGGLVSVRSARRGGAVTLLKFDERRPAHATPSMVRLLANHWPCW